MTMNGTGKQTQLLTAKHVAKALGISPRTVFRLRSSGRLPKPVSIGGSIRWKLSDIQLFIDCDCDMASFKARKEGAV